MKKVILTLTAALVSAAASAVFSITVSTAQAPGTYLLAEGAEGFNGTITLQNASGGPSVALAIGRTVNVGDSGYRLDLTGDRLIGAAIVGIADITSQRVGCQDAMEVRPPPTAAVGV